jgi:neutral ceramidase
MRLKKILRILLKALLAVIAVLVLFVGLSTGPVDRTPAQEDESYQITKERLAVLDSFRVPGAVHSFSVGYAKVNLTPEGFTSTAGYGKRKGKLFTSVHDSIHVRAMVIDNGRQRVAIVSADLLIIPPSVTELLEEKLKGSGFSLNNTYLGATHTHNSIGNWGKGAARFIYGAYREEIVEWIADRIVKCIVNASENPEPAYFKTGAIPIAHAVGNRLVKDGPEDPFLRVIEIHRSDSSKLLLMSYAAHATCVYSQDLELSRDYPGKLVDTLEAQGYEFAMFMAGSVGSQSCTSAVGFGWDCIDWMAGEVSGTLLEHRKDLQLMADSSLAMVRLPLALSDPQVKLTRGWKVYSWLFHAAFGEYETYIQALRLGDVIMLGAPCDFSGEFSAAIDSAGNNNGFQVMVTSFNGGYIGYVTPVNRYDLNHTETRLMNWYAPGTGEYIEQTMEKLIDILKE